MDGSYLQPLPNGAAVLLENNPSRYATVARSDEAVITDPAFGRRLSAILPCSKTELQMARVLLVVDSTLRANYQYNCLLSDVRLLTIPLATLEEIQQILMATFVPAFKKGEGKSDAIRCPPVIVVGNVFDHLAVEDRLKNLRITGTSEEVEAMVVEEAVAYTAEARTFFKNMKDMYPGVHLFLTAPPGYTAWPIPLKLFVRTVMALLKTYGITMLLPAPNVKVCMRTYRPPDLLTSAFFAGLSKLLMGELWGLIFSLPQMTRSHGISPCSKKKKWRRRQPRQETWTNTCSRVE